MANIVLIGAQWGDEGKGKIIDVLSENVGWIVRFQGGNNAGHTVEVGGEKYVLHLMPSGILRPGKKCVIGNGVVVDVMALADEIEQLEARGVEVRGRLFVSDRAHLVLPYHRRIDEARERNRSQAERIGTTKRGIGPAYADKASRTGLRVCEMLRDDFEDRVRTRVEEVNRVLRALGADSLDAGRTAAEYCAAARRLEPYIADTVVMLNEAARRGEGILFEGAQGTMLDLDHGTYPYVTSSSATVGGACVGSGVAPGMIESVIGVIKAYTTRVGEGPFPTELADGIGERIREDGNEFGATTGRPRRCGWFDAVVARQAAMVNGIRAWALTKLDVLDQQDVLKICVAYEYRGRRLEYVPADAQVLAECRPVYESMPGWRTATGGMEKYDDLPDAARAYIKRLEELTGVPVGILSLGPRRRQTVILPAAGVG